jgi:hypothetical protein
MLDLNMTYFEGARTSSNLPILSVNSTTPDDLRKPFILTVAKMDLKTNDEDRKAALPAPK